MTKSSDTPTKTSSKSSHKSGVPAGFYDEVLADVKARDIDIKALAAKQIDEDWKELQAFVAEVEVKTAQEDIIQEKEQKVQDAIESLENMEYMDRYRRLLEKAEALKDKSKHPATNVKKSPTQDHTSKDINILNENDKKKKDGNETMIDIITNVSQRKRKRRKRTQTTLPSSPTSPMKNKDNAFDWRTV